MFLSMDMLVARALVDQHFVILRAEQQNRSFHSGKHLEGIHTETKMLIIIPVQTTRHGLCIPILS